MRDMHNSTKSRFLSELGMLYPRILEWEDFLITAVEKAVVGMDELFVTLEEIVDFVSHLR